MLVCVIVKERSKHKLRDLVLFVLQVCPKGVCLFQNLSFPCAGIIGSWSLDSDTTTGLARLDNCPTGYYIYQSQECRPCEKGFECLSSGCTICSECGPGTYKATATPDACTNCSSNKYRVSTRGQAESDCETCACTVFETSCALYLLLFVWFKFCVCLLCMLTVDFVKMIWSVAAYVLESDTYL